MGLRDLIKNGVSENIATATRATLATVSPNETSGVAKVATVAVAKQHERNSQTKHTESSAVIYKLIDETLSEIDLAGRPWDGFYEVSSPSDRLQLRDAEARVDDAVLANDYVATQVALREYKELALAFRCRLN